jgi:hypothetical protein
MTDDFIIAADNLVDLRKRQKFAFGTLKTRQVDGSATNISSSAEMFSHNCATPPYPMPNKIFSNFDLQHAGELRGLLTQPQVVRTPHVYLAFYSTQLPTTGAFGSLGLDTLDIEGTGTFFRLSLGIADQWLRLEKLIIATIEIFSPFNSDISSCKIPPLPSRCNYIAGYQTSRQAHGNARRAQRAFRPLMSLLLFSLAVLNKAVWVDFENLGAGKRPRWQIVMEKSGAPFAWIDELRYLMRALSHGEIKTVGAIVASISEVGASRLYRTLVTYHVACWYLITPGVVDNVAEMDRQQQGYYLKSIRDAKVSSPIAVSSLPCKELLLIQTNVFYLAVYSPPIPQKEIPISRF